MLLSYCALRLAGYLSDGSGEPGAGTDRQANVHHGEATTMGSDKIEDEGRCIYPTPETALPSSVEFEVRITVPLVYTMKVRARSANAYDLVGDLSWPDDFETDTPTQHAHIISNIAPIDDTFDPLPQVRNF
jgi:hypothetical protein